jgi:hypothetical protein
VDFSKLSREDWMVGGGSLLLIIDLLFFAWHSYSFGPVSVDSSGTGAPDGIWGVLALIVAIVVLGDLLLARFSPETQIPTTQLGRDLTRAAAAGFALLFLLIKFVSNTGSSAFGCWLGLVLGIVVVVGAWFTAQGRSTTVGSSS